MTGGVGDVPVDERAADFAALFDTADVGVARINAKTRTILDVNAQLAAMLGYASCDLVGRSTDLLLHPDPEGARASFRGMIATSGSASREARLVARNGRLVPVRVQASLVTGAGDPRLIVLVHNLTASKAAEKLAFDDHERTRLAMEAANAGAWEYRFADNALIWSPGLFALYSIPPSDPGPPLGEWFRLIHPDDRAKAVPPLEEVGPSDMYSREFRVATDDGWRWIGTRGRILRDAHGAPERVVGINIDLSEQRASAAAITAAAGRFRAAVDAMAGVLWTNSPDGRMIGEQPGWTGLTGQSEAEYRDYGWSDAVHPDDAPAAVAEWNKAVAERRPYAFEHRLRVASGAWRWFSVRAMPVFDAMGAITEWVGVHTDVHDARTAEAELKARVAEAVSTREVALAQLHEAQKLETIGHLTGGVAHDFNNLLTPIIGSLDLLQRRGTDPRSGRLIDGALQAADRAKILVQRLLAFSRRQTLAARPVDIVALVDGIRDLLARSIGPAVAIEVAAAPDVPPAMVDSSQLELAILNLAVNARDAMPGGGTLRIAIDDAGGHVRLTVSDTGHGMDETTLRRAIEPFFSTKGVGRGTGLGLSMVHGLAAQSGGRLVLDSAPDEGTRAELWLPVATAAPVAVVPLPPEHTPAPRTERILLVDDEAMVRSATADMLTDLGYTVVEADGARAALAELERGPAFDLLVTDYLMPETNGADLVRAVRAKRPGLPALLVTGFADAASTGPDLPRLAKPFRQADLGRALAAILG